MSVKTELMAIHIGLISAMKLIDTYDIIIITDSISVARKILESKVDPPKSMVIPLVSAIESYLSKDTRNNIHFWHYPSKVK